MICCPDNFEESSAKKEKDPSAIKCGGELCRLLERNRTIEEMRNKAVSFAASFGRIKNSAQIGRYVMMVKQAKDLTELQFSMVKNIKSEESKEFIDKIIKNSEAEQYRDDFWREYLLLILTLLKYKNRGDKSNEQDA